MLVDWAQNSEHKSMVRAYWVRAKARPPVSTPVAWEEVESGDQLVFGWAICSTGSTRTATSSRRPLKSGRRCRTWAARASLMPPLEPTLKPMLAQLVRELPRGDFIYEPKWDGFRCLAFRDGDQVDLRSRHGRPLARYFPEVVAALLALDERSFVLDGELVVVGDAGFDFPALMGRLHPAVSRVELLSASTPAVFVAFDLLAVGDSVLCARPFRERRSRLSALVRGAPSGVQLTPATDVPEVAEGWLRDFAGGGIDGVVAKAARPALPPRREGNDEGQA